MFAALEIIIIPAVLLVFLIIAGLAADFGLGATLVAGFIVAFLVAVLLTFLREEKEWEGPLEDHEKRTEADERASGPPTARARQRRAK